MKELPEAHSLEVQPVAFMDGARGAATQVYRSEEWGVTVRAERESREQPFVSTYSADILPDRSFGTFAELREAYNAKLREKADAG